MNGQSEVLVNRHYMARRLGSSPSYIALKTVSLMACFMSAIFHLVKI